MHFNKILKLSKPLYILIAVQLLILLTVIFNWRIQKKDLFTRDFTLNEYNIAANTVVDENVLIDRTMSDGGIFLSTPKTALKKGTYHVFINYIANTDGHTVSAQSSQIGPMEIRCIDAVLNSACNLTVMTLDLTRDTTDLTLNVSFSGKGTLIITGISIVETTIHAKRTIVYAFAFCLLLNFLYLFWKSNISSRKVMLALIAIFGISCYPLYMDYLIAGHDIPVHLLRIEGLSEGLAGHIFPVKIHPVWAKDYGYAIGVMYPDTLLYFPAILRRFGFSVQSAYKIYVAAVNLGTVIISYFSFKRMFRDKKTGLFGCLIYSLSIYRFFNIYTRAAAGEYTAMMFFPLVLCGFYLIFTEVSKDNLFKYAVLTALGLTGLVQSHTLSCEMAALIIIPLCLILIRRVCQRYTFTALSFAAVLTILLNIGFLVPFLDYYNTDLYITSENWSGSKLGCFQEYGLYPSQLFTLFGHSLGDSHITVLGALYECTFSMGIFFLFGLLLFLYLLLCHYQECRTRKDFRPACICTAAACLLLYMSTCYFPWNALIAQNKLIEMIARFLQFPWRLLGPATILLTFSSCFAAKTFLELYGKQLALPVLLAALTLSAVNCGWYLCDFTFSGEPYRVYATNELDTMTLYSCEYLPTETALENIEDNLILPSDSVTILDYRKNGTTIDCTVEVSPSGGYIDFPLVYYKYYICEDISTEERMHVSSGFNNMVRAAFPENYSGSVSVRFQEPLHWRVSELVSLLTFLVLVCIPLCRKYRIRRLTKNQ